MKSWYSFSAKAEIKTTEVSIYDEIGMWGITAKQFIDDLKSVDRSHKISLRIHSPGGSVFDGNAIANALNRHVAGYEVQIEGLAASMATVISLGGKPVRMAENGFYMIHNPWGLAIGDASEMRDQAELLDKIQQGIVNAYANKSGQTPEQIQAWMDAETWFTAQEAKDAGFVDEITDAMQLAASADRFSMFNKFTNIPENLTNQTTIMTEEEITTPAEEPEKVETETAVKETPAEETPEVPATLETPIEEIQPVAKADDILAKFAAKDVEINALKLERDTFKAALDQELLALSRLESSLGLASAKIVPAVEPDSNEINSITSKEFNKLSNTNKSAFLKKGGIILN